jgi:hypothetical protein
MSIITEMMYLCDGKNCVCSNWRKAILTLQFENSEWHFYKDKHYCPRCWEIKNKPKKEDRDPDDYQIIKEWDPRPPKGFNFRKGTFSYWQAAVNRLWGDLDIHTDVMDIAAIVNWMDKKRELMEKERAKRKRKQ